MPLLLSKVGNCAHNVITIISCVYRSSARQRGRERGGREGELAFETLTYIQFTLALCLCVFRDVGVKAIENLMEKKGKFDYILLETTGLADPGPIAAMFWLDDDLGSEIYLDGKSSHLIIFKQVVTVHS